MWTDDAQRRRKRDSIMSLEWHRWPKNIHTQPEYNVVLYIKFEYFSGSSTSLEISSSLNTTNEWRQVYAAPIETTQYITTFLAARLVKFTQQVLTLCEVETFGGIFMFIYIGKDLFIIKVLHLNSEMYC